MLSIRRLRVTDLTVVIACYWLCGCAARYRPLAPGGGVAMDLGGYTETRIADNVFRVTFEGNLLTIPERTLDFALLRCAELALANGFPYFAVVDGANYAWEREVTVMNPAAFSSTDATKTTTGMALKPATANTIMCFKEKPEGFAYSAAYVVKSLKKKYRLK